MPNPPGSPLVLAEAGTVCMGTTDGRQRSTRTVAQPGTATFTHTTIFPWECPPLRRSCNCQLCKVVLQSLRTSYRGMAQQLWAGSDVYIQQATTSPRLNSIRPILGLSRRRNNCQEYIGLGGNSCDRSLFGIFLKKSKALTNIFLFPTVCRLLPCCFFYQKYGEVYCIVFSPLLWFLSSSFFSFFFLLFIIFVVAYLPQLKKQ